MGENADEGNPPAAARICCGVDAGDRRFGANALAPELRSAYILEGRRRCPPQGREDAMLRGLARMAGHAAMLAGFALAVADGARSIAASAVSLLPLEQALTLLPGRPVAEWGGVIAAQVHPLLWDPLLVWLLRLPAAAACFLAGGILLLAGRRQVEASAVTDARHPGIARGEA